MAILRGGKRIDGYDIRIGLPRDRSLDNVGGDKRLKQKAGANTQTTMGNFISQVNQADGFAKKARYFVEFQLPRAISVDRRISPDHYEDAYVGGAAEEEKGFPTAGDRNTVQTQLQRSVGVFCNSLQIPDRIIDTHEVRHHGPSRKFVTGHSYEPIALKFYADKFLRERMYFETWQKCGVSNETHNVAFYDDYVSQINIFGLGSNPNYQDRDDITYMISLIDCFPTNIGNVEMAADPDGGIVQFDVTMSYRYWLNSFIDKAGNISFAASTPNQPIVKEKYSRFPWLNKLPKELRRTGRDFLGAVKNRIPYGKIFKGIIFPPVFS